MGLSVLHTALAFAAVLTTNLAHTSALATAANVSAPERAALVDLWTSVTGLPAARPSWASGDPCVDGWVGVGCSGAPVAVTFVLAVAGMAGEDVKFDLRWCIPTTSAPTSSYA